MTDIKLERQKLYEEIWQEAMNKVAKKYNLSDNGLRKICKKLEIPLPDRSYWGKFHFGKNKPKIKLLPKYDGEDYYIIHATDFVAKQNEQSFEEYLYHFNPEERAKIISLCSSIDSSGVISKYHHIIDQVKEEHRKQDVYNKNTKYNLNKTETNPEVRKRIYLILHLIFTNLEKLGYKAQHSDGLQAIILGEKINFRIREKNNVVYVDDNSHFALTYGNGKKRELEPNGLLELSIIRHYDNNARVWISPKKEIWTDTKTKKLEDSIGDFIVELIYCACKKIDDKEQRKKEERDKIVKEEIRQAKKEIQDRELERFKDLEKNAMNYVKAEQIRQYIQAFSKRENLTEEDIQYVKWANAKADWLDPIIKGEDAILDEKI